MDYSDGEATAVESTARGELPFGIYFEPLATDYYYRYSVDMLPIFLTEIATLLVIVFTTFKVAMANKKKEGTMLLSNGEFTPNIHS